MPPTHHKKRAWGGAIIQPIRKCQHKEGGVSTLEKGGGREGT